MKILVKKCLVCGKKFIKPKKGCSIKRWNKRKFCSPTCSNKGQIIWNKGLKGIRLSVKTEFKKGNIPWHKGTIGIKLGKPHTKETKEKIRLANLGAKSHFWKGGVSKDNYRLRRTVKYREFRNSVYKRDNYTCQKCNQRGGRLQVHHIKSWANYPELRFSIDNGQTLCISCHIQTDSYAKSLKFQRLLPS